MTYTGLRSIIALLSLIELWLVLPTAAGQDGLTNLLAKLTDKQFDRSVLYALEGHPSDGRILPALKQAFDHQEAKHDKQAIAVTLIRLGDKSEKYFGFLAGHARRAIEDRTPSFAKYDGTGRDIRGEFSAEFLNWCALNDKDPRSVAAIQVNVFPEDVLALARTQDPRAAELLRMGLDSQHPNVVAFSVQGLGRLQDVAAIPLIAKACERLPSARLAIAMELPWYSGQEAEALIGRLEPDRKSRDFHRAQVERTRLLEIKSMLSRTGVATPK